MPLPSEEPEPGPFERHADGVVVMLALALLLAICGLRLWPAGVLYGRLIVTGAVVLGTLGGILLARWIGAGCFGGMFLPALARILLLPIVAAELIFALLWCCR